MQCERWDFSNHPIASFNWLYRVDVYAQVRSFCFRPPVTNNVSHGQHLPHYTGNKFDIHPRLVKTSGDDCAPSVAHLISHHITSYTDRKKQKEEFPRLLIDRRWSDFEHFKSASHFHSQQRWTENGNPTGFRRRWPLHFRWVFNYICIIMVMMRDAQSTVPDDTIWCRRKLWAFDQTWRKCLRNWKWLIQKVASATAQINFCRYGDAHQY
jgi:hypothetical protein